MKRFCDPNDRGNYRVLGPPSCEPATRVRRAWVWGRVEAWRFANVNGETSGFLCHATHFEPGGEPWISAWCLPGRSEDWTTLSLLASRPELFLG